MRNLGIWLWLAWAPWAWAHEPQAHHEHGVAYLDIVSDQGTLDLLLRAPLASLIGFEHTPTREDEKALLQQALATLNAPQTLWVQTPCQFQTLSLRQHGTEHPEVHSHYQAHCELKALNVQALFSHFSHLAQLKLQRITASGQKAQTVTAEHALVELN